MCVLFYFIIVLTRRTGAVLEPTECNGNVLRGQHDLGQGSAALEGTLFDRGEVGRQRDLGQGRAALEFFWFF